MKSRGSRGNFNKTPIRNTNTVENNTKQNETQTKKKNDVDETKLLISLLKSQKYRYIRLFHTSDVDIIVGDKTFKSHKFIISRSTTMKELLVDDKVELDFEPYGFEDV